MHTPVPDNSRGYAITIDRFAMPSCAFRFLRFFALLPEALAFSVSVNASSCSRELVVKGERGGREGFRASLHAQNCNLLFSISNSFSHSILAFVFVR